MGKLHAALATAILTILPGAASALTIAGSFTATDFTPASPPDDFVSGSFTAVFDVSGLTGSGSEAFAGTVTAIDLTIDGFSYGVSDVSARVAFLDGQLFNVTVGSYVTVVSGCSVVSGPDNFCLVVDPGGGGGLSYGSTGDVGTWGTATVTSVIPEPSTAMLLGFGLIGLGLRRRRGFWRAGTSPLPTPSLRLGNSKHLRVA